MRQLGVDNPLMHLTIKQCEACGSRLPENASGEPVSLNRIAMKMGISKSNVYRLITRAILRLAKDGYEVRELCRIMRFPLPKLPAEVHPTPAAPEQAAA